MIKFDKAYLVLGFLAIVASGLVYWSGHGLVSYKDKLDALYKDKVDAQESSSMASMASFKDKVDTQEYGLTASSFEVKVDTQKYGLMVPAAGEHRQCECHHDAHGLFVDKASTDSGSIKK